MYRLALALLILAATPAAASAAPFGELSPLTVEHPARCLRATGAPGEVVRWAPGGADFLQATASGFGAPVHVALGDGFGDCPLAMAQPSGAAIVVEQTVRRHRLRGPRPRRAPGDPRRRSPRPTATPSTTRSRPSRRAATRWSRGPTRRCCARTTPRACWSRAAPRAVRSATPIELQPLKPYRLAAPHIALGMQDDGTVTALWNADGAKDSLREQLFAAVAAPGAPFGPAQRLSEKLDFHEFSVTVAPDGRALAIVDEGGAHARAGAPARRHVRQGGRPRLHRHPARRRPDGGAAAGRGRDRRVAGPVGRPGVCASAATAQDRSAGRSSVGARPLHPYAQRARGLRRRRPRRGRRPRAAGRVRRRRPAGVHVGARPHARRADLDRGDRRDVPRRRPGAERPAARRGLRHAGDPRGRPARDRLVGRLHRRRLPPAPRDRGRSRRAGALGAGRRDRPRRADPARPRDPVPLLGRVRRARHGSGRHQRPALAAGRRLGPPEDPARLRPDHAPAPGLRAGPGAHRRARRAHGGPQVASPPSCASRGCRASSASARSAAGRRSW